MDRHQIEKRKVFTQEEQIEIRKKSDGKCCHCGRYLTSNFTVDHVIPLSKGGTNDMGNLVALCNECNKEKKDYIIYPDKYYKFLKPLYMDELEYNQKKYYSDYKWFNRRNVFPEDIIYFETMNLLPNLKLHGKKKGKDSYVVKKKHELRKAFITDDYGDICDFVYKYNKKYYSDDDCSTIENVNEIVLNHFNNGVFYYTKNTAGEIVALLATCVDMKSFVNSDIDRCHYPMIIVRNIMTLSNEMRRSSLGLQIMNAFITTILDLKILDDKIVFGFDGPTSDPFVQYLHDVIIRPFAVGSYTPDSRYVCLASGILDDSGLYNLIRVELSDIEDEDVIEDLLNEYSDALGKFLRD